MRKIPRPRRSRALPSARALKPAVLIAIAGMALLAGVLWWIWLDQITSNASVAQIAGRIRSRRTDLPVISPQQALHDLRRTTEKK